MTHPVRPPVVLPASALLLLVGLTLGWGFNWTVMKVVLADMAPLAFRAWCTLGAALGLFALAAVSRLPCRIPRGQVLKLCGIALFNVVAWNLCLVYGLRQMDSGRAAIITFTLPVWSTLGSIALLGERMDPRKWLGLVFGVGGIVLLLIGDLEKFLQAPLGTVLMLGASMSWSMGMLLTKRWSVTLPASSFTAWQFLIGMVPLALGALLFEPRGLAISGLVASSYFGIAYNVLISSMFCMWAWTRIVVVVPAMVSSLSPLFIPVVGVFSGMLLLGEQPKWNDFGGLILVSLALATVVIPGRSGR